MKNLTLLKLVYTRAARVSSNNTEDDIYDIFVCVMLKKVGVSQISFYVFSLSRAAIAASASCNASSIMA